MSDGVERRALLALYRNHPATAPGDRYNWKARAEAHRLRDMLLGWAVAQSDESLLHCRNLGPVALRWIRGQTGDPPSPFNDLEAENARLRIALQHVVESNALDADDLSWLDKECRAALDTDRVVTPDLCQHDGIEDASNCPHLRNA